MTDFFTPELSKAYDEKNSRVAPIAENMHFLIRLILNHLPQEARILCVGVGTGAEILSLAQAHPHWTFTGVDPSASMLEVCRDRLSAAGFMERCELVHGYVDDVPLDNGYDAVLSVLVGHFIKPENKAEFYSALVQRLKSNGYFVNAEISFDLDLSAFPLMLENWKEVQKLMGASELSLNALPKQLREMLHILPPLALETIIKDSGIPLPVRFFQAFMISSWYGRKQ